MCICLNLLQLLTALNGHLTSEICENPLFYMHLLIKKDPCLHPCMSIAGEREKTLQWSGFKRVDQEMTDFTCSFIITSDLQSAGLTTPTYLNSAE